MPFDRLIPLGNRVVVEPLERKHQLFYLPPETTTFTQAMNPAVTTTTGRIVAIGPDVRSVEVGETIRCSDSCGHLIRFNEKDLRVIREDDVACIL